MDLRMPLVAAVLVLVFGTAAIAEDDKPIEAFFGEYEGTTVVDEGNALSKRELHVEISEAKKGFRLSWKTVIHKPDGRKKTSENAFEFRPSGREGISVSAVRKDMFGNRVPLDPLKGESFLWAKIVRDTLSVYAMVINDEGAIELQIYDRTLTEYGLELKFSRFTEGWLKKAIIARLDRVDS